jgi:hypothetical protein
MKKSLLINSEGVNNDGMSVARPSRAGRPQAARSTEP